MDARSKQDYIYVRISLASKHLTRLQRLALFGLGAECVDDGNEHEAYGVIPNDLRVIEELQLLDDFIKIELAEPPTGP